MGKANALLSFLYLFPSEHYFLFSSLLSSVDLLPFFTSIPIRIEMRHVYKLQMWAFKPETVRLLFCLISSSMDSVCPGCWNGCLPLPLYKPSQPFLLLFGEKGKGFFPLNYFLTPWVRFSCSWWQCCSTVVKSRQ